MNLKGNILGEMCGRRHLEGIISSCCIVLLCYVRVTVTLLPDAELGKKMEAEEKDKIEAFRKSLTVEQVHSHSP
jgi:hypothetical protein